MGDPTFAEEIREFAADLEAKGRRSPGWKPMFLPYDMAEGLRVRNIRPEDGTAESIAANLRALADIEEANDA